jgi:hypothetical protein
MWTLLREGGIPIAFILVVGVAALVAAVGCARRPTEARIRFASQLARALLYGTLVGLFADLAAVLHKAPAIAEAQGLDLTRTLLVGFGEATSPAILGFAMLALVSLFLAVAARRLARIEAG